MSGPIRTGSQGPLPRAPGESRVLLAGVLAVAVHLVALIALTYGFHIQQTQKEPMAAELWASLPPPPRTVPEKPVPKPPRPAPEPEPAPKPKPVPPPVPRPPVPPPPKESPVKAPPKADIELKAKEAFAAKRAEDEKRRLEEAKKRENEKLKAEARATAIREAEALAQKLALAKKEEQAKKDEQEKLAEADRLRKEQEQLVRRAAEAAASAQSKLMAAYSDKIRSKVRRFIVEPPGVPPTAIAEFEVVLIPGGEVLSVRLLKSSGNAPYDEAAERAIRRAEPLPIPPEPQLFPQFRTLKLTITPKE